MFDEIQKDNGKLFYNKLIDCIVGKTNCCGGAVYSISNGSLERIVAIKDMPIGRSEAEVVFHLYNSGQMQKVNSFEMSKEKISWVFVPLYSAGKKNYFALLYVHPTARENRDEIKKIVRVAKQQMSIMV